MRLLRRTVLVTLPGLVLARPGLTQAPPAWPRSGPIRLIVPFGSGGATDLVARVYAEAMLDTVKAWVPMAFDAFRDYRLGAVTLSAQMMGIVKRMLAGEAVTQEGSGLSKREWRELMDILGRDAA